MKHTFIVVSQSFATQYDGYQAGCNVLKVAVTNDGIRVTSANALNEFPELFEGRSTVSVKQLSPEDFPSEPNPFK